MPSKRGGRKSYRSSSSSSASAPRTRPKTKPKNKAKSQNAKADSKRRRRSSSSSRSRRRRSPSSASSSKKTKKLRPKKRSSSPGKPFDASAAPEKAKKQKQAEAAAAAPEKSAEAVAEKKAAEPSVFEKKTPEASAKKPVEGAADAAKKSETSSAPSKVDDSTPAAGVAGDSLAGKLTKLADIEELQRQLDEDKDRLQLFVIKAKQEHEEKRETKEKCEQREREYFKEECGMPCGPNNRFLLEEELGKGVFSTVYQAKDMAGQGKLKDFAIKFIRKNTMCRQATEREIKLMRRLRSQASVQDPEGAQRLMALAGPEMFDHQGHLAVVLQLMKCDLRTVLRKYGKGNGLSTPYVHTFARDIFLALRALRSIKIVHTDLKPDNLLISLDRISVRLSDFGSAMDVAQTTKIRTDYMQPRFYRAPEVILGQPYSTQIDVWSAGATLYELATDRALFHGLDNNGMIHEMLKVSGSVTKELATSGKFASKHFSDTGDFLLKERASKSVETVSMSSFANPSPSVLQLLEESAKRRGSTENGSGSRKHLADLISQCCTLDAEKRITPKAALAHVFVQKSDKAVAAKATS